MRCASACAAPRVPFEPCVFRVPVRLCPLPRSDSGMCDGQTMRPSSCVPDILCDGQTLSIALQCQTVSPPQCAALGAGSWWLRPQGQLVAQTPLGLVARTPLGLGGHTWVKLTRAAVGGSAPTGTGGSDPAHAWRVQCTSCGMHMGQVEVGQPPAAPQESDASSCRPENYRGQAGQPDSCAWRSECK